MFPRSYKLSDTEVSWKRTSFSESSCRLRFTVESELCYPGMFLCLSNLGVCFAMQKANICYLSFPDSNSGEYVSTVYVTINAVYAIMCYMHLC